MAECKDLEEHHACDLVVSDFDMFDYVTNKYLELKEVVGICSSK